LIRRPYNTHTPLRCQALSTSRGPLRCSQRGSFSLELAWDLYYDYRYGRAYRVGDQIFR
jgi:hypothetical protein